MLRFQQMAGISGFDRLARDCVTQSSRHFIKKICIATVLASVCLSINGCYPGASSAEIAAWSGFTPQEAQAWNDAGFGPEAAQSWTNAGVGDPATATAWQQLILETAPASPGNGQADDLGYTLMGYYVDEGALVSTVGKLVLAGIKPSDVKPFIDAGLDISDPDEIRLALSDHKAGFSYKMSIYYATNGIDPAGVDDFNKFVKKTNSEIAAYQAKKKRVIAGVCNGQIGSEFDLMGSSPYATSGKCYSVQIDMNFLPVCQWLGPSSALVSNCNLKIEFDEPPDNLDTLFLANLVVIGEDPFEYSDVLGTFRTIPDVRVIFQINSKYEQAELPTPPTILPNSVPHQAILFLPDSGNG